MGFLVTTTEVSTKAIEPDEPPFTCSKLTIKAGLDATDPAKPDGLFKHEPDLVSALESVFCAALREWAHTHRVSLRAGVLLKQCGESIDVSFFPMDGFIPPDKPIS